MTSVGGLCGEALASISDIPCYFSITGSVHGAGAVSVSPGSARRGSPLQMGAVMNKSRALSLCAVATYSMFMILGCNVQLAEDDQAGAGESELVELEQRLQCGTSCRSNYHPTRYSCSLSCGGGTCTNGVLNQVECELNRGTFAQCGTVCPNGWHATQLSCTFDCGGGTCINFVKNQARCEPNSGTFTQCGTSCPSGWRPTQYSCTLGCGGSTCSGVTNQVTCAPVCDPRAGTRSQMWINEPASAQYMYRYEWCSIGTLYPPMCWEGTYYHSQYVLSQSCSSPGSYGSCEDPDAWWNVTCRSLIDCVYDCSGRCVPAGC